MYYLTIEIENNHIYVTNDDKIKPFFIIKEVIMKRYFLFCIVYEKHAILKNSSPFPKLNELVLSLTLLNKWWEIIKWSYISC